MYLFRYCFIIFVYIAYFLFIKVIGSFFLNFNIKIPFFTVLILIVKTLLIFQKILIYFLEFKLNFIDFIDFVTIINYYHVT